jgi:uncharacterized protein YecT (DUF1311 family)
MKLFLFLLFLVMAAAFPSVDSFAQSQAEMNEEAGAELEKADARLNMIYRQILSENASDSQFCADLRGAQRAWIKFVELHMRTLFPLKEGENPRVVYGSMYPMSYASEKTRLVLQRIEQLELLREGGPE